MSCRMQDRFPHFIWGSCTASSDPCRDLAKDINWSLYFSSQSLQLSYLYFWVSGRFIKVGCIFLMVIWPEFRTGQYKNDDYWEDAPHFISVGSELALLRSWHQKNFCRLPDTDIIIYIFKWHMDIWCGVDGGWKWSWLKGKKRNWKRKKVLKEKKILLKIEYPMDSQKRFQTGV